VTPDTIAADLIRKIGPQGETYLTQDHTMERLRSAEYFVPDLAVRGPFAVWQAAGGRDTTQLARELAAKLSSAPGGRLPTDRRVRLEAAMTSAIETVFQKHNVAVTSY